MGAVDGIPLGERRLTSEADEEPAHEEDAHDMLSTLSSRFSAFAGPAACTDKTQRGDDGWDYRARGGALVVRAASGAAHACAGTGAPNNS